MIKVTFRAFDRELIEYFKEGTLDDEIALALFEKCYTYKIISIETIKTI